MANIKGEPNSYENKELKELNSFTQAEHNGVRENGVLGNEKHKLLEEDETRNIDHAQDVTLRANGIAGAEDQSGSQAQYQRQPVGQVVRWDRFLPLQSLKVLLVENDDSTRQVVSALLCNCGYEVCNATNAAQAWKLLEDLTICIDLVLTEAAMPCLSGIGLLCKIMSHKTRKNIPVIMMSSVDSMNLVFQCLSKGAADFLFKPVRKNELKNLWQHVWRRCHSSSGSASESSVPKSKSVGESDNNTSSNDENDNASVGLSLRDGSDNGSGTQSSWTKRTVEVESPQLMLPWKQPAEPHDSTCAQADHPWPENYGNEGVSECSMGDVAKPKKFLECCEMGKDLEIRMPTNPDLQLRSYSKAMAPVKLSSVQINKSLLQGKKDTDILNDGTQDKRYNKHHKEDGRIQADDKIGAIGSSATIIRIGLGLSETMTGPSVISEVKDKVFSEMKEIPSLDLSLKRLRSIGEGGKSHKDDGNILKHSYQSAFSRYITANSAAHLVTGCGGSCSVPLNNNSSDHSKPEFAYNLASNSDPAPINQGSNGSSSNNDMESTTKNAFTKPATIKDKPTSMSSTPVHTSSAFHTVQHWHSCSPQQVVLEKAKDIALAAVEQASHQVQVEHHHFHYHHHRHHVHNVPQPPSPRRGDEELMQNNMVAVAPQCGSSNVIGGTTENIGNYSLNGSASGSHHGSNGRNGSSTAANNGAANIESDNGTSGKSGTDDGSGIRHGGIEQNCSAQREAALTRFHQKRKERCYEKKVRYQSRKKLAEQRPRVRGQFVKQTVQGQINKDPDSLL